MLVLPASWAAEVCRARGSWPAAWAAAVAVSSAPPARAAGRAPSPKAAPGPSLQGAQTVQIRKLWLLQGLKPQQQPSMQPCSSAGQRQPPTMRTPPGRDDSSRRRSMAGAAR